MKPPRRRFLHLAAGAAALPAMWRFANAQAYPSHPIRFVVPLPAGGPSDVLARIYAQKLSQRWNQPVVVENRIGAPGTIGTEAVIRAPRDGYTLLFTFELPITMAPALFKLRYDPQRDVAPIAMVAKNDNLLVVNHRLEFIRSPSWWQRRRASPARSPLRRQAAHLPRICAAKCLSGRLASI
jgi:tripartite-type tricarboxylate transporter receptor subunit TctC